MSNPIQNLKTPVNEMTDSRPQLNNKIIQQAYFRLNLELLKKGELPRSSRGQDQHSMQSFYLCISTMVPNVS